MSKRRVEFQGDVHLVGPLAEFTICGVAEDAEHSERDQTLRWQPTKQRTVTCKQCVRFIWYCRNVPTR